MSNIKPTTYFTIIIPFRNESKNLPILFDSLSQLDYPLDLYCIYLVDDFSTDDSVVICKRCIKKLKLTNTTLLKNKSIVASPKKSAILTALEQIDRGYVLSTDADCQVHKDWLLLYDKAVVLQKPSLLAGPVQILDSKTFWGKFQILDLISLQVIGLGSFKTKNALMCNAANMAYDVRVLKKIKAFESHQQHISGDDVFTLHTFQQKNKQINAVVHPNAVVWTKPQANLKALIHQRIRWASKTKFYNNSRLKFISLIVLLTNLLLLISLSFAFQTFYFGYWIVLVWLLKMSTDFIVLWIGARFFKNTLSLTDYLVMISVYPFVSVFFAAFSLRGKFNWKERQYKV